MDETRQRHIEDRLHAIFSANPPPPLDPNGLQTCGSFFPSAPSSPYSSLSLTNIHAQCIPTNTTPSPPINGRPTDKSPSHSPTIDADDDRTGAQQDEQSDQEQSSSSGGTASSGSAGESSDEDDERDSTSDDDSPSEQPASVPHSDDFHQPDRQESPNGGKRNRQTSPEQEEGGPVKRLRADAE